jgi:type IV secretory pathway TraG/TraD family ATPase VirD4
VKRKLGLGLVARILYILFFILWLLSLGAGFELYKLPAFIPNQAVQYFSTHGEIFFWYFVALFGGWAFIYCALTFYSMTMESAWFRKLFVHGTGGSARWGGPLAFTRHEFPKCKKNPIFLGRTMHKYDPWPFCRDIGVDDNAHMITVGMQGSGKSTTAIWPNLANHKYPDSVFILDPKGEHATNTASIRQAMGQQVFVLDPFGETEGIPTHSFNPLAEIDIHADSIRDDLTAITEGMVIQEGSTEQSKHFTEVASTLIKGLIVHVLSTYPEDKHNLPFIRDLIIKGASDSENNQGNSFEKLLDDMAKNDVAGGLPMDAVNFLDTVGNNERGSFLSTVSRSTDWTASPVMREHLLKSDFSLSDLKNKKVTVYVVLPFRFLNESSQIRYMRVLLNQALVACQKTKTKRSDRRVLFILDEFARLGLCKKIKEGFVTLRSSNVKLWCFFQNLKQIEEIYSNAHDFMGSATRQFFGINDHYTAEEIEKLLGKYLDVRKSGSGGGRGTYESQKKLLDATEIMDSLTQESPIQIVITAGGTKMELKRVKYFPTERSNYIADDTENNYRRGNKPPLRWRTIRNTNVSPEVKPPLRWRTIRNTNESSTDEPPSH